MSPSLHPELETLSAELKLVPREQGAHAGQVRVVKRRFNRFSSTFFTEIVTCRLAGGKDRSPFRKYAAGKSHNVFGHHGGVDYQAEVYRHVLIPTERSTPRSLSTRADPINHVVSIVLEQLENGLLQKKPTPTKTGKVTRWSGQFHAAGETRLRANSFRDLKQHDAACYLGWAQRTANFSRHLHDQLPWREMLCTRFNQFIPHLVDDGATIVHSESDPKSILVRHGIVCPLDWEAAVNRASDLDLASICEGWPEEILGMCEVEYQCTRGPDDSPARFQGWLTLARLSWYFRWLPEGSEWTV